MKTFKNLTLFILISVLVVSCKKNDDGGDGGTAASGTITAKVDGATFTSMEIATTANQITVNGTTTITIQGSDSSGKGIVMIINGFDGIGTYEINDSNVFISGSYIEADVNNPSNTQTWQAPYENSGVAGEIQVSAKTATNIQGTFNFKCKNSMNGSLKNITEGSFNMDVTQN